MFYRVLPVFLSFALFVSGCLPIKHFQKDQRVVVLPSGDPGATLVAAQAICQDVSRTLGAELHQRFPQLTQQQMQGVFLNPSEGTFSQGGHQVFILTGINYEGSLPDAKAIADVCESTVRTAVAAKFPSASSTRPTVP